MPYIPEKDRPKFNEILNKIPLMDSKGELEYCIFKLMKIYMRQSGRQYRYSTLHDVAYSAMHCADEFRRRFLDVRENYAMRENGDIE
jgi:hypothetical protein